MNIRKIFGFGVGPIATAVIGVLTAPLIAWMFSAEDVGRLYLAQTIISFSVIFLTLGLDQAYIREFHGDPDKNGLLKTAFMPGFALLLLLIVPVAVFSGRLSPWLFGLPDPIYVWITFGCVALVFLAKYPSLTLRMHEHAIAFSMSQILPKLVLASCLGLILVLPIPREFLALQIAALISTAAVTIIMIGAAWPHLVQGTSGLFRRAKLREMLGYGLPLLISGLVYWALSSASALALRFFSSFEEMGIYSISMSIASVAIVFQAIVQIVWAPIVYKWEAASADMARVAQAAKIALVVCLSILILCGLFSWLVDFVLPEQYNSVKFLVMGSLVQPLLYTLAQITGIGIGISRRPILFLWSSLLSLAVSVVLNIVLVPGMGAAGAVIANAVAFYVYFLASAIASARVWRRVLHAKHHLAIAGAVLLAVVTVAWGAGLGSLQTILAWLCAFLIAVTMFRPELRGAIATLATKFKERGGESAV